METKNFQELVKEGEIIMVQILGELNNISNKFIHTDPHGPDGTWRRFEDKQEICVALALAARNLK